MESRISTRPDCVNEAPSGAFLEIHFLTWKSGFLSPGPPAAVGGVLANATTTLHFFKFCFFSRENPGDIPVSPLADPENRAGSARGRAASPGEARDFPDLPEGKRDFHRDFHPKKSKIWKKCKVEVAFASTPPTAAGGPDAENPDF